MTGVPRRGRRERGVGRRDRIVDRVPDPRHRAPRIADTGLVRLHGRTERGIAAGAVGDDVPHVGENFRRGRRRRESHVERDRAVLRDEAAPEPAFDHRDVEDLLRPVFVVVGLEERRRAQRLHERDRLFDRVDADRRVRRVRRHAFHVHDHVEDAALRRADVEIGRLADDGGFRRQSGVERAPRAFAALEVIGNGEQRHLAVLRQPERRQHGGRDDHRGGAALHVRRARPVQLAVADRRAEGLEAPRRGRRVDVEVTIEQERSRACRVAGDGQHVRRAGRSGIGVGDVDAGAAIRSPRIRAIDASCGTSPQSDRVETTVFRNPTMSSARRST